MIWYDFILRKLHAFSLDCNENSFKSQINKFTNEPLNLISNQKPKCQPPVSAYHFSFQLKEFLCQTQLPIFPIFSDRYLTIYCNFPKLQSETYFRMSRVRQSKALFIPFVLIKSSWNFQSFRSKSRIGVERQYFTLISDMIYILMQWFHLWRTDNMRVWLCVLELDVYVLSRFSWMG